MRKPTGRPPGRPRKDGTPARTPPVPGPGQRLSHQTQELVPIVGPKYTVEQQAEAVTAYAVTNSPSRAHKLIEGLWGPGAVVPEPTTIRGWVEGGIAPDEKSLDRLRRLYEVKRADLAMETFEKTQTALMGRDFTKEKLFNVIGAYKIAGETLAPALARPQGATVYNMPGAMFIRGDKPVPKWDHEVEGKVIDGNGD